MDREVWWAVVHGVSKSWTVATEHTHQSLYLAEFGGFKSSGKVVLVFWIMLLHFRYLMNS